MYSKEELHNALMKAYQLKGSVITTVEAGKALGCCAMTFRKYMLEANAYEDCPDVFRHIQKPIRVFENLDHKATYWLGYLMADGCIACKKAKNENQNDTYRLMLECKTEDKEIIEKFCEYVKIRKERITSGHQGASVALSLSTKNFTTNFSDFGLVPNKSHNENHVPQKILENDDLFFGYLKGLVDGDGTIHTAYGSPGVSLVSNSLSMLNEIKNKLELMIPEPTSLWIIEKTIDMQKGKNASQSLFTLKMGSGIKQHSNLKFIYDKFYSNGYIVLSRKEQSLKSLI